MSRVLARGEQRHGEERAGDANAEGGAEQLISVLYFRHVLVSGPMKDGSRENENGGVDKKGEHEGEAGIDGGEFDRLAFSFRRPLEIARLHDGRVQIEVMRHDGCAQDADAHVEHILIF